MEVKEMDTDIAKAMIKSLRRQLQAGWTPDFTMTIGFMKPLILEAMKREGIKPCSETIKGYKDGQEFI